MNEELSKLSIMEHPYLENFTREQGFQNKRFSRYVKRIKDELFEFVTFNTPLWKDKYATDLTNLEDYLYHSLIALMSNLDKKDKNYIVGLHFINFEQIPHIIFHQSQKEMIENALVQHTIVYGLLNDIFPRVIIEFLSYEIATNENINEINYIRETLPLSDTKLLKLLNNIFSQFIIEFEHMAAFTSIYEKNFDICVKKLVKDHMDISEKNDEILTQLEKYRMIIENLNEELKITEAKYTKKLNDYTKDLRRENSHLKKQNEELKKSVEKMREKNIEEKIVVREKIKEKKDISDLKLLFIINESCTFLNELQNAFPNAKITFKNYENTIANYNCVVVFTSFINHPTYYHVKEICKQTNTKLIHCGNTNVEKIKEVIIENI